MDERTVAPQDRLARAVGETVRLLGSPGGALHVPPLDRAVARHVLDDVRGRAASGGVRTSSMASLADELRHSTCDACRAAALLSEAAGAGTDPAALAAAEEVLDLVRVEVYGLDPMFADG